MEELYCPICGNTDSNAFGYKKNGELYCRKCLSFKGKKVDDKPKNIKKAPIFLEYELSQEQKELSQELINNFKNGINSLIYAVCGSGKTEIVLAVISYAISNGLNVGFAVPRRDVAIELKDRFSKIFKLNKIALVHGGKTDDLSGDLVCLTTHQLYRYDYYFHLLIMDEIDAFPYQNNNTLQSFFEKSVRGNYILMSATPGKSYINEFKKHGGKVLTLFKRFHGCALPVPTIEIHNSMYIYIALYRLIKDFINEGKQLFIFTPTINSTESTFKLINHFIKGGTFVHSKCFDREARIEDFRRKKYKFIITTAVLERGVTVENLQVIVFGAEHPVYTAQTLEQIAGRVGRKSNYPTGEVIYLAKRKTKDMEESIRNIEIANKDLQNLFKKDRDK